MMTLFEHAIDDRRARAQPDAQRYRMAPVNPEQVVADAVLDDLAEVRRSLLNHLRARLATLYRQRLAAQGYDLAYVTADDARVLLDTDPRVPPPDRLNRNFLGSLFARAPEWEATGELIKSRTPGSHANLLRCWRLRPAPRAEGLA